MKLKCLEKVGSVFNLGCKKYDLRDQGISPVFNKRLKREGRAGVQGIIFGFEVHWQLFKLAACQIILLQFSAFEQLLHLRDSLLV